MDQSLLPTSIVFLARQTGKLSELCATIFRWEKLCLLLTSNFNFFFLQTSDSWWNSNFLRSTVSISDSQREDTSISLRQLQSCQNGHDSTRLCRTWNPQFQLSIGISYIFQMAHIRICKTEDTILCLLLANLMFLQWSVRKPSNSENLDLITTHI